MREEKDLTPGLKLPDKKLMLRIWVDKDGTLFIESVFKVKEQIVRILTDSLAVAKSVKDNVININPGQFKEMLRKRFRPNSKDRVHS